MPDFTADQASEAIVRLFDWSQNFDFPSPASLFLDIIGHSEEHFGARLCADSAPSIGYLEAEILGQALAAWADRPRDCEETVETLLNREANQ